MRSLTYAIFVSGQAPIYAFCRSYCCGFQKNYFSVFSKTKLVSFTCDPRWFPGQSLRENSFLTRNALDRSYRHCHLSRVVLIQETLSETQHRWLVFRTDMNFRWPLCLIPQHTRRVSQGTQFERSLQ